MSSFTSSDPNVPTAASSVEAHIGKTPLIPLARLTPAPPIIWIKHEGTNPGGSIRDRTVLEILNNATASGLLWPGDEIAIAGATNSAMAAALIAGARGYPVSVFHRRDGSPRLLDLLAQHGATVHLIDGDPTDAAAAWARQRPGRIFIDAGRREALCDAIRDIGRELLHTLHGKPVGAFVTSYSTGATLHHVAGELRRQYPALQVFGVRLHAAPERRDHYHDVAPSITMERHPQGDAQATFLTVREDDAWAARALLERAEHLLLGPKGAAAALAALRIRHLIPQDAAIIALSIDDGHRYPELPPDDLRDTIDRLTAAADPIAALHALAAP
jgi:cysteine synthase A